MGRYFDLALSVEQARSLAQNASPPYGILLISANVPGEDVRVIASTMRDRKSSTGGKSDVCVVIMHHPKRERADQSLLKLAQSVLDREGVPEEVGTIRLPTDDVQFSACRPIRKAFMEKALAEYECTHVKYDTCGMNASSMKSSRVRNLPDLLATKLLPNDWLPDDDAQVRQGDLLADDGYLNFVEMVDNLCRKHG